MTEKMIRDAYVRIRTIDQTIPDDVLDFMKDASIEKLKQVNNNIVLADVSGQLPTPQDIQWKARQLTNTAFNEWWDKQVGNLR